MNLFTDRIFCTSVYIFIADTEVPENALWHNLVRFLLRCVCWSLMILAKKFHMKAHKIKSMRLGPLALKQVPNDGRLILNWRNDETRGRLTPLDLRRCDDNHWASLDRAWVLLPMGGNRGGQGVGQGGGQGHGSTLLSLRLLGPLVQHQGGGDVGNGDVVVRKLGLRTHLDCLWTLCSPFWTSLLWLKPSRDQPPASPPRVQTTKSSQLQNLDSIWQSWWTMGWNGSTNSN